MHGRVLSYELRGIMTKSPSSSSASRAAQVPALSKAALQDSTNQPGRAYQTTLEARLDHAGERAALNIRGLWGVSLLNSREQLLAELFPDLNQEYDDWHLTYTDPCNPSTSDKHGKQGHMYSVQYVQYVQCTVHVNETE